MRGILGNIHFLINPGIHRSNPGEEWPERLPGDIRRWKKRSATSC